MCVYIYTCKCVYVYIYIYACIYTHVFVYNVRIFVYIYLYTPTYRHIDMHMFICVYILTSDEAQGLGRLKVWSVRLDYLDLQAFHNWSVNSNYKTPSKST